MIEYINSNTSNSNSIGLENLFLKIDGLGLVNEKKIESKLENNSSSLKNDLSHKEMPEK